MTESPSAQNKWCGIVTVTAHWVWNFRLFKNKFDLTLCQEEEYFVFVSYTIIQNVTSSEICALHLTHPSAHTPGAGVSQCCSARGAVGGSVPCSRVSPQSWYWRWRERSVFPPSTDNSCQSWDSNPQPRVTSLTLYPFGHDCTHVNHVYSLPPKLSSVINTKFGSCLILCIFATVASILIGKDD